MAWTAAPAAKSAKPGTENTLDMRGDVGVVGDRSQEDAHRGWTGESHQRIPAAPLACMSLTFANSATDLVVASSDCRPCVTT